MAAPLAAWLFPEDRDIMDLFLYQRDVILQALQSPDFAISDDLACPFGVMKLFHVLLSSTSEPDDRLGLVDVVRKFMEIVLDYPRLSFDFSESTRWGVSALELRRLLDSPAADRRFSVSSRRATIRVAVCNMHDGSAFESYTAALAALDFAAVEATEAKFYWTRVANHAGGRLAQTMTIDEKIVLNDFIGRAKRGELSIVQFQQEMTRSFLADEFFVQAELWLCGEVVFPCILVFDQLNSTGQTKPMATLMNMSLLTLFPWSDKASLAFFFEAFRRVASHEKARIGIACLVVAEQIRWQTGFALDYVRFQSRFVDLELQLERDHESRSTMASEYSAEPRPFTDAGSGCVPKSKRALFYRNNLYHLNNFHVFVRRVFERNSCALNFKLVDMNELGDVNKLSFADMRKFDALILLSYIPNALRLTDALALGRPVLTPGKALANKFIWNNQPFGGFLAPEHWRSCDERFRVNCTSDQAPFPLQQMWSAGSVENEEKMWHLTEWARTPGLTYFESVQELLSKLNASETLAVPDLATQREEAAYWWRSTLDVVLSPL